MMTRTTQTTLKFQQPFVLSALDERLPPGTYKVVVDEAAIPGLSFLAFRQTQILLHTPAVSCSGGATPTPTRVFVVDRDELADAFYADRNSQANPPSTREG
jgi:hypothetical protein